ncbi:MAG: enoyl-CoA hydratase/isomerase family protein [Pseudomonadales bacterium]
MSYDNLELDIADGVACITLNRPKVGNAISPDLARELSDIAVRCDDNADVRAVVLTGSGKLFCAGGDLGAMATAGDEVKSVIKIMAGDLHMALSRFSRGNAPVIAAVNGTAGGAGMSLVMAADLAICGGSAKFTMAYTNAGLSPDGSSTFFMPRKIGDRRTRELILTNRVLSAAEAEEWGIVNRVVADDEVLTESMALAKTLAQGPTLAYGASKALLNESFEHGLEAQMELETRAIGQMVTTADGAEGIQAFLNKRKPSFTGR